MIHVRVADPAEYDRVGELTIAAYGTLPVDHLWGGYDDGIRDTAARAKQAEVLVAVVDDRVVGAVTYVGDSSSPWSEWTEPGEAQFRLLSVDPVARGQGVGEAMVRVCMARAAEGRQPILIYTTSWLETAQRMYQRLGFVRRPDRDASYEMWNDPPVAGLPDVWIGQPFLAFYLAASDERIRYPDRSRPRPF